jgi:hypothetical protein
MLVRPMPLLCDLKLHSSDKSRVSFRFEVP